jgi:4-alpha-glucanotransferase
MKAAGEAAIEALADAVGIEPSYRDTDGHLQHISTEAKRALLLSMGHALDSEDAVRAEVATRQESDYYRLLAPVVVLWHAPDTILSCPITFPDERVDRSLDWSLQPEQGAALAGSVSLASLKQTERCSVNGVWFVRAQLPLPKDLENGYHRLTAVIGGMEATATLIVAPATAFIPDWLARGERRWGMSCPLFSIWSASSWGIGDLSDLAALARVAGRLGASFVGLNPLHAPLPGQQADPSPYMPSSRIFLNPLHINVANGMAPFSDRLAERISDVQASRLIAYPAVRQLKQQGLEAAYRSRQTETTTAFRERHGIALVRFAVFNALQERFGALPWQQWPSSVRTPTSAGIADFARGCADRIDFHIWAQWVADQQLADAAAGLRGTGAESGLYQDLAIGISPNGADAWANQDLYVAGASIGAPPDGFNPAGQDWGAPPPDPSTLRASGYAAFIAMLRANMRHARILRIDHVMGLQRLYWVARGAPAKSGAYVRYPLHELLGIVTLESHRNRCLVVGEDLGTLPEGFRERMADANVMSYRLMMFERYPSGLFRRPATYPRYAVATFGTHDLPSLRSWWQGQDLEFRRTHGLSTAKEAEQDIQYRHTDRELLVAALHDQQLINDDTLDDFDALVVAIERFLARTPSALMMANLTDLLGEAVQINMPGTVSEHANWRHRFRLPVDVLDADPLIRRIAGGIVAERGPGSSEGPTRRQQPD